MGRKMLKQIRYSYKNKGPDYTINMEIDLSRFEKQYSKAQYELDSMIMTHMVPYMPRETGTFISVTRAMSAAIAGTGKVVAAAPPMGRFLYEGKPMVGQRSRSAWAQRGEKKEVVPGKLDLSPGVDHWFDEAKSKYVDEWVEKSKKIAGGG